MEEGGFLVGFKFEPSEQELLRDYLYNKVTNNLDPSLHCYIEEIDFYGGSVEVSEIWDMLGGPALEEECTGKDDDLDVYVFTHLKRKATTKNNAKNFIRTVGTGCWQAEDSDKLVLNDEGGDSMPRLGSKKRFKYVNKKKPEFNGMWNMMEFNLEGSSVLELIPNTPTDIVLCRIRKNKKNVIKKRKFAEIQQVSELNRDDDDIMYYMENISFGGEQLE